MSLETVSRDTGGRAASGFRAVAVDLGAESGRVMLGTLDGERVELEEVHRFPNVPVRTPDGLHWDPLRLFAEIVAGLRRVSERGPVDSIGVDSWGCDYGLLDEAGRLLGNPYHYRDGRTDGVRETVARQVPPSEQYARTGIAQLPFNTIYQLAAQRWSEDISLERAATLLLTPDLMHYWLSGEMAGEYTNATTSGMLGVDGRWTADLLQRLGISTAPLLPPVQPGTEIGALRRSVQADTGLSAVPVTAPGTHDTASAVVAVPMEGGRTSAYISSGTWSLLGLELDRPITTEDARLAGFTNEGGVGGTYRFLTNIMGLWLVQGCRRVWAKQGGAPSYEELIALAERTLSPGCVLDVSDPELFHPEDMVVAINHQLGQTGQSRLDQPGPLIRAIFEGLALAYRVSLREAEELAGVRVDTIHVVGGGSRNGLLCQLTADACGRQVVAGPAEATALGNVLAQAMGRGRLSSLAEARAVVRATAQVQMYEPAPGVAWEERGARLGEIRRRLTAVETRA